MMMKGLIERALEAVDLEHITKDVLSSLAVRGLEIYFVVRKPNHVEEHEWTTQYEFVGLAYSKSAAGNLWLESGKAGPCRILELDMGKALELAEEAGIVKVGQE
jgi:hypothetical protein